MVMGRQGFAVALALISLVAYACGGGGSGSGGNDDRRDPTVFTARATEVPQIVDEFRTQLGRDNGGVPERGFTGRREVDWDGVPDENSSPGPLDPDFFNTRSEPRARGIRLTTPGDSVQVSADSSNPPNAAVRFGNVNPTYEAEFVAFSEERLFSPIGSNVVDVTFAIPGSPDEPALTNGFGVVLVDVDENDAKIELFAEDDRSLGEYFAPTNDGGLSFVGVIYEAAVVKRVRITYGNHPLGPTDGSVSNDAVADVVSSDDFIYGEPQPQDP
jgi:hypothetical protein